MTPTQFKPWFAGFCESVDSVPTEKQWNRIKAVIEALDESALDSAPSICPSVWPVQPHDLSTNPFDRYPFTIGDFPNSLPKVICGGVSSFEISSEYKSE